MTQQLAEGDLYSGAPRRRSTDRSVAAMAPSLDLRVRGIGQSATMAINARCEELRRDGHRVYRLGLGQSPFPIPDPVVKELRDHATAKSYLPVMGLPELREAVASYRRRRFGNEARAEDVLIGPGSKELMFLLQLCFYGDMVIPVPAWVSYAPQAHIVGRRVELLPTAEEDRWLLRPERLYQLCRQDPDRPRVLVLNSPSNPTGTSYSDDQLGELAEVAAAHRVIVLSDEIYGELHHDGGHASMARHHPEGTIISSGLSKWCGAGGWRLGTFTFPPQLAWLRDAMGAVASETYTSVSAPIQYAAVRAFEFGPEVQDYLQRARRVLKALGNWMVDELRGAGIGVQRPDGGFYLYVDFRPVGEQWWPDGITGAELCEALLRDTGVAVLPGSDFGRPAHELSARLAYVDFDGGAALEAARRSDVDLAFLERYCTPVVEAVRLIAAWTRDEVEPRR